jgi:hypothetical protein
LLLICGALAAAILLELVINLAWEDTGFLVLSLMMLPVLCFAAYAGWRHAGDIDPAVWRMHGILFPVMTVFCLMLSLLGYFLLLRARRYFRVDAEALLAVDKRPPILFLRSFADDKKQKFSIADRALIDFSLETRLAKHFSKFGPLINNFKFAYGLVFRSKIRSHILNINYQWDEH